MTINANNQGIVGFTGVVGTVLPAALAEGTNANTFKTAAAVAYAIDSICYLKAATDNLAFSAGHTALAAGQSCLFGVVLDASGNVTTVQGNIVTTADLAAKVAVLNWPRPPANKAVVGYIRVQCDNAATFTPGSTDLGAPDVVDTYYNTWGVPAQPLTA